MRALVVDDSGSGRGIVTRVLRGLGFECVEAGGGADALEAIAREPRPALVTVTRQLPGMDGLELTRRLKADPTTRHILVVALTAYAMKGDEEKARASGCDGYVTKPVEHEVLLATIAGLLGRQG